MVRQILEAAGFVENETYKKTRFLKVPSEDFAVYFDDEDVRGSDFENLIKSHSIRIEVYSYGADCFLEAKLEAELNWRGIPWSKSDRVWLRDDQYYMTAYYFDYQEKMR
ncbi:hypothetical protein [uncultured Dubosiella sp.]|uniref:hypothetical protein n=1 Tax=uncultured Dubosiella sp. TaxID=1937011 RepID=UPI00272E4B72|nr:hypothetical protein [uncultured Dubosiella sp.]